jgi:hypothetical protein
VERENQELKQLKSQIKTLQQSASQEVEQLTRQLNMMAEQQNKSKAETES